MLKRDGFVEHIEPGIIAWSTTRGRRGVDTLTDEQQEPLGGIVLRTTSVLDQETGAWERAFVTLDHTTTRPRLHFAILRQDEINRDTVTPSDASQRRRLWRRLAEEIAFSSPGRQRRGVAGAHEVRVAQAMCDLMMIDFGPDGGLHNALRLADPSQPESDRPTPAANVPALVD